MSILTALSLTIGILGGLATYLLLGPAAATGVQLWAVFLGAASFFHCGGMEAGLKTSIIQNIFGIFVAWVALMVIVNVPLGATLGVPLWAGIVVAISVILLVLAANIPMFSVIPAAVYGYAATAAYALLATKLDTLTVPGMTNPAITAAVSLVIGNLYGFVAQKLAVAMAAKAA